MFGFLKAMFEKEAEAAIQRRALEMAPRSVSRAAAADAAAKRPVKTEQRLERMDQAMPQFVSAERQALIRQATAVVRAKRQILDDLDDESRAKLVAMAITTFLHDKTKP